jgi:hypothetical protein
MQEMPKGPADTQKSYDKNIHSLLLGFIEIEKDNHGFHSGKYD